MEHEGDSDTDCKWCTWNYNEKINKGSRRPRNNRTSKDHLIYSVIKIGQNTEKSPGDMGGVSVTQTSLKNHQLMLM